MLKPNLHAALNDVLRPVFQPHQVRADRFTLVLDILRVFLGGALLIRGLIFVEDTALLFEYINRTGHWFLPFGLQHYVVLAHLGGGLLLALGLLTRVAAVVQLPALIGAVFCVHFGDGFLSQGQSLELSSLVLVLLLAFSVTGAGPFSIDHIMANSPRQKPHEPEAQAPERNLSSPFTL